MRTPFVLLVALAVFPPSAWGQISTLGTMFANSWTLVCPWSNEPGVPVPAKGTRKRLKKVEVGKDQVFKEGQTIWTLAVDEGTVTAKNKIKRIELVFGSHGFEGEDVALELTLTETIEGKGRILVLGAEIPKQKWKIKKEKNFPVKELGTVVPGKKPYQVERIVTPKGDYLLLSLPEDVDYDEYWLETAPPRHLLFRKEGGKWVTLHEDRDLNLSPLVDLDGDDFPEFFAPFPDSADARIVSLLAHEGKRPIVLGNISSGH